MLMQMSAIDSAVCLLASPEMKAVSAIAETRLVTIRQNIRLNPISLHVFSKKYEFLQLCSQKYSSLTEQVLMILQVFSSWYPFQAMAIIPHSLCISATAEVSSSPQQYSKIFAHIQKVVTGVSDNNHCIHIFGRKIKWLTVASRECRFKIFRWITTCFWWIYQTLSVRYNDRGHYLIPALGDGNSKREILSFTSAGRTI